MRARITFVIAIAELFVIDTDLVGPPRRLLGSPRPAADIQGNSPGP